MRDVVIHLRARPEQRDLLDQAARLLGKTCSDFMLEVACERAKAVLADQTFFSLAADQFRAFNTLLDASVVGNPGLERLMAVRPPWDRDA